MFRRWDYKSSGLPIRIGTSQEVVYQGLGELAVCSNVSLGFPWHMKV